MDHNLSERTEPRIKEAAESITEGVYISFTTDEKQWERDCESWKKRSRAAMIGLAALELDIAHVLALKDDALRDHDSLKAQAALEVRI